MELVVDEHIKNEVAKICKGKKPVNIVQRGDREQKKQV